MYMSFTWRITVSLCACMTASKCCPQGACKTSRELCYLKAALSVLCGWKEPQTEYKTGPSHSLNWFSVWIESSGRWLFKKMRFNCLSWCKQNGNTCRLCPLPRSIYLFDSPFLCAGVQQRVVIMGQDSTWTANRTCQIHRYIINYIILNDTTLHHVTHAQNLPRARQLLANWQWPETFWSTNKS